MSLQPHPRLRILSLRQPWASLVAQGRKRIETRSWRTRYRGAVLIHASGNPGTMLDALAYADSPALQVGPWAALPRGAVLALAELVDVRPTCVGARWVADLSDEERARGDFTPYRYGWFLEDVRPIDPPIPHRGGLGLYAPAYELVAELLERGVLRGVWKT